MSTPTTKPSPIFTTKRARIETISEALERFAGKICAPDVAQNIKDIVAANCTDETSEFIIQLKVRPDLRSPGMFMVSMQTKVISDLGNESFNGLR